MNQFEDELSVSMSILTSNNIEFFSLMPQKVWIYYRFLNFCIFQTTPMPSYNTYAAIYLLSAVFTHKYLIELGSPKKVLIKFS